MIKKVKYASLFFIKFYFKSYVYQSIFSVRNQILSHLMGGKQMIKFRGISTGNLFINQEYKLGYIKVTVCFDSVGQYFGNCDMSNNELYDGVILEVINGSTN